MPCTRLVLACALASVLVPSSASALPFGKKDTEATAKVTRGGPFKGQSTYALGAFRVAFILDDKAFSTSSGMFAGGGSSAAMSGEISGVDHALMQKIADEIYADFLAQAAAKGFSFTDSATLAKKSASYAALDTMENFEDGRLGTYVIPAGQRSVALPGDGSKKMNKGAKGMFDAMRVNAQTMDNSEANKAFPKIAAEVGNNVLAVTIVVNFANFKGGHSSFGSSKATIQVGATVDGSTKTEILPFTGIAGWEPKTPTNCGMCHGEVALDGQVHSNESIGTSTTRSTMSYGDHVANGLGALTTGHQDSKKGTFVTADPVAYEKNVLAVAQQASDILLTGLAKEK